MRQGRSTRHGPSTADADVPDDMGVLATPVFRRNWIFHAAFLGVTPA
jgi:hypothetical protein